MGALAAGWLLAAGLPAQAAPLEEVQRRGELRVAADPSAGQPYFAQSGEAFTGFEAELARALAAQLGVKAVFVATPWAKLLDAVREGRVDVAINALEIEACPDVRFSQPYYVASQGLLVKKADTRIYGVKDLSGRAVGTTQGSVAAAVLQNLPKPAKVKAYPDTASPFKALATGQVEAVLLESAMVRWQAKQQPAMFRLAGLPMLPRPYGAAVRDADATLLDGLNGATAKLRATGALRKLLTGYGLWDSVQEAPKPAPRPNTPKR
jgi:polar amino acid transport system substrate-binding protein